MWRPQAPMRTSREGPQPGSSPMSRQPSTAAGQRQRCERPGAPLKEARCALDRQQRHCSWQLEGRRAWVALTHWTQLPAWPPSHLHLLPATSRALQGMRLRRLRRPGHSRSVCGPEARGHAACLSRAGTRAGGRAGGAGGRCHGPAGALQGRAATCVRCAAVGHTGRRLAGAAMPAGAACPAFPALDCWVCCM